MKKLLTTLLALTLTACMTDAQIASQNLSVEAGNFKVDRRIVFYNGITDSYILVIEGKCQIEHEAKLSVTCKTGENSYKKGVTFTLEELLFMLDVPESYKEFKHFNNLLLKKAMIELKKKLNMPSLDVKFVKEGRKIVKLVFIGFTTGDEDEKK